MTDEVETKAPTVEELQSKVSRLTTQVAEDTKAVEAATGNFKSVMKSGDVDKALEAADERTKAQATLAKSTSQLKTATNAVTSANYAQNAEKIAALHEQIRTNKELGLEFVELEKLGVTKLTIERSEESGKLIINSAGPTVKRPRSSGGTGSRGQPVTVDGTEYASASAAMKAFYPDSGPLNRDSIISKLTNAGHEVA